MVAPQDRRVVGSLRPIPNTKRILPATGGHDETRCHACPAFPAGRICVCAAATGARDSVSLGRRFPEAAARFIFWRSRWSGGQFKGHVFVFSRGNTTGAAYGASAAQLLEFGADGRFLREIGHNLYAWSFAHTVKIDPKDNIWVTDKGSDMVIKFNPEGRVAMVCGRKQEASDEDTEPLKHPKPPLPPDDGRFRQVTDVA